MAKKGKSTLSTLISREYFKMKFNEALEIWLGASPKNTLKRLAQEAYCHPNSISEWRQGKKIPSDSNLDGILNVLKEVGITKEFFFPTTREERYQYDSSYMDEVGREHFEYCKQIGLEFSFLRFLQDATNMSEDFPLYSPIEMTPKNLVETNFSRIPFDRFADSAEMTQDKEFQICKEGKVITLHHADLQFMKEMQEEVKKYIPYLYYKRHREMEKELEQTRAICETTSDGVFVRKTWYEKDLRAIDRFRQYVIKVKELDNGNDHEEG